MVEVDGLGLGGVEERYGDGMDEDGAVGEERALFEDLQQGVVV